MVKYNNCCISANYFGCYVDNLLSDFTLFRVITRVITRLVIILLLTLFCCNLSFAQDARTHQSEQINTSQSQQNKVLRIGVLAFRGMEQAYKMWLPTADYLSDAVAGSTFSIIPLTLDNIAEAIKSGRVDFVLTNPASYAGLEITYGISRIATLRNHRAGGSYTRFGALILTRADRDDIQTLADLKNKTFMAVHKNAFGGWWMAWREFLNVGIDPFKDLKNIEFVGFPQDKIIRAIGSGRVDAGTVRTDLLERLAMDGRVDINDFKILNQKYSEQFPFVHSTMLYPEWPFAVVKHTSEKLAHKVAIALLNMKSNSEAAVSAKSEGWTVPLDYQSVHDLMKYLSVGPYVNQSKVSFSVVLRQYWKWIVTVAVFLVFLFSLVFYMLRLNSKLKLSQQESLSQEQRIRSLYDVASKPGFTFDQQITEVLQTGCVLLGTEIGRLCQIDEKQQENIILNVVAPEESNIKAGIKLPLEKTFCNVTFSEEKGVSVSNAGKSEWKDSSCYEFSHLEAYIATPIYVNGKKFGTINYSSHTARTVPFKETDMDLVRLMGRNVSLILERQISQEQILFAKIVAEEANSAKSAFLANMSHEIRTPLTSIIGFGESLLESNQGLSQRQSSTKTIVRSGKHLLQIINDILDLSKVEANRLDIEKSEFSPFQIISEVDSLMQKQARDNSLDFTVDYIFPLPDKIYSEPVRLKQILINLCSNAIKFTEQGSVGLSMKYNADEQCLEFVISDTGIGLTSIQIDKIFNPFTQADSTTTRKYGGTGLGLSLSKQLVELLGGSIEVDSVLGEGSTFCFSIKTGPVHVDQLIKSRKDVFTDFPLTTDYRQAIKVEGNILLAEDNTDNQALISMYLKSMEAEVKIVSNGKEAIDAVSTGSFDLILMDMQMPVMDGIEAVTRLRESGYEGAIAALTANAMKEDRLRCMAAGCNDFVTKPINRTDLIAVVAKYLTNGKVDDNSSQDVEFSGSSIESTMLVDDPDFLPLLKGFIENLGVSVTRLTSYAAEKNWVELKLLIHQVKGLGGGYGYPMLTDLAIEIELQAGNEDHKKVSDLIQQLQVMYKSIQISVLEEQV